jgi:plastocyanin
LKQSNIYLRAGAMLLALMLALFMAACGSDDGDTDSGAQPEETSVETGGTDEETEEAPGGAGSQVAVTATEFEFTGIDPTLPAGETTFNFVNDGKQPHEFVLFKLTDDAPALDKLLKLPQKKAESYFEGEPDAAFAKPGESQEGAFTTELTAGNYAYVCFVEDKKTKQPHAFLGMVGAFAVQ